MLYSTGSVYCNAQFSVDKLVVISYDCKDIEGRLVRYSLHEENDSVR
jgi:hypothetical protein